MKIIVDKREKESLVGHELISMGINVEFQRMPVADYLIGNVAIERKTASDFINSLVNKRLFRQLEELKQFEKAVLIIEGDFDETDMNPNSIKGMLLSIMLDYNTPIAFTKDYQDTAKFLNLLVKRNGKKKNDIGLRAKKKVYSIAEQQQMIIEGLPSVGPSLAKALLKKFKTVKTIANATEEELQKVEKLGKKKAKIIKNILEETYRP